MILVSSCLLDLFSKYNGSSNANSLLLDYCHRGKFIPVCPEQLGGLPTPRKPVELFGASGLAVLCGEGKAVTEDGSDCTPEFVRGAEQLIKLVRLLGITAAILKERSPSCGSSYIYDGSFSHAIIPGEGVAAALLRRHGIPVYSEQTITRELLEELLEADREVENQ
jgi:uncharacterized protein YbbK (DUF523 family)